MSGPLLVLIAVLGLGEPSFEARLQAARQTLAQGRLEEAEGLFRELSVLYPYQVSPYLGLAEVIAAQGQRDDAVDLLLDLGWELRKIARHQEARAPLALALRFDPERAEAHALLGGLLREEHRYRDAVAALERAVALGSRCLQTHLDLASSYWQVERYAVAETTYRRALELDADAFAALVDFGRFLLFLGRAGEAAEFLKRAAALKPDNEEVLPLLESALAEARTGPDRGGPRSTGTGAAGVHVLAPVILTSASVEAGLLFRHDPAMSPERRLRETMGAGLAWLDYDGDGWWDLYLVQSRPYPPQHDSATKAAAPPASCGGNRLYRNRGDGTFEDVTERSCNGACSCAGERSYGQGAVAADLDGDGATDLFVTQDGPDLFLRNRGDGTFEDQTEESGLALDGWSSSAAVADSDGDGDLDLFVTGYVEEASRGRFCGDPQTGIPDYCNVVFFPGADDAFFLQREDGTFEERTLASGFENPAGRGLGVIFTDLNGDARPDLYVANDLDPNRLYRNRGDGTFEDVSLLSGAAFSGEGRAEAGMGVAAGDLDGDGLPDLLVTNFDVETNTHYQNLGGLQFKDVSAQSGFGLPSFNQLGFGVVLVDLNLDGALDAFIANGHVFERPDRDVSARAQQDLLLLGDGRGRFLEQTFHGPAAVGRGLAAADYDGDGDVDLAVQNNGSKMELWRNDSPHEGVRWLGVELRGATKNTEAVGARLVLVTDRRRLTRWVLAGESYQSSSDRRTLFAWPATETARELEITWPSGRIERWRELPESRYVRFHEYF